MDKNSLSAQNRRQEVKLEHCIFTQHCYLTLVSRQTETETEGNMSNTNQKYLKYFSEHDQVA